MKKFILILISVSAMALSSPAATAPYPSNDSPVPNEANAKEPELTVSRNSLTIKAEEDCALVFEVYSITGQLVKKFQLENGRFTLELPRGYYIVKCASWSKKVIIKG